LSSEFVVEASPRLWIHEIPAQAYHITEKRQEFNLLENISQIVVEIVGFGG